MATKRRPTMDHSRDAAPAEGGTFTKYYNPLVYKPWPDKVGTKFDNKVFFSLMAPYRWSLFNPTPDMVGKFDMVGTGNSLVSVPSELTTFSFKFPVHPVSNFRRDDGTTGFASVICPIALNDYLMRVHGYGALFNRPRCACCEKANEQWKVYNERWEDLGYDQERKKGLGKEEYKRISESDPVLKKARAQARMYASQERYLVQVWDHSKFCGDRPFDEGQEGVQFQFWLAPKGVHDTLLTLANNGVEFYDATADLGLATILVTKDTSKCSANDFSQTKYTLFPGKTEKYPSDWTSYLDNEEVWPDPTGAIVCLASYEDMRRTLLENEAESGERNQAPATARTFTAPPAPPMRPPVANFSAPVEEPVEEPVQAMPSPPKAPVPPSMPSVAAPAASAPPMAAPPSVKAPMSPVPTPPPSAPAMPSFGTAPRAPGMDRPQAAGKRHNW